jgi:hypothetical protein
MSQKRCSKCKEVKLISEFNKDKSKKDGHYYQCKECSRLKNKRFRDDNKPALSNYSKKIVSELKPCYVAQKLGITLNDEYILNQLLEAKQMQIKISRKL